MSILDARPYRTAVGAVVLNADGHILTGMRNWHPRLWKMPQGGVQVGETFEAALRRELKEETGILDITIQRQSANLHTYDYPRNPESDAHAHRGQQLTWFLVTTSQRHLDPVTYVPADDVPEFMDFRWADAAKVVTLAHNSRVGNYVSAQRKEMYRKIFSEFGL